MLRNVGLVMSLKYVFGSRVFLESLLFFPHFEVNIAQLIVLVGHRQGRGSSYFHHIFEGHSGQLDRVFVLTVLNIEHGEKIIKFSDSRVVLSLPEGIFQLLHLVYLDCLLKVSLFDAPLDSQQTALGRIIGMWLQQYHVINAQMLKLIVLAVWDKIA